jgi:hypothetical protein
MGLLRIVELLGWVLVLSLVYDCFGFFFFLLVFLQFLPLGFPTRYSRLHSVGSISFNRSTSACFSFFGFFSFLARLSSISSLGSFTRYSTSFGHQF